MSLPELTPDKITLLQQRIHSATTFLLTCIVTHMTSIFTDSVGISHQKVLNFNSTFSSKVPIKYLLHTSHDSLGHVGATNTLLLYKKALLLPRHEKVIHKYVRICKKCQTMNLLKLNDINLCQEIVQTP